MSWWKGDKKRTLSISAIISALFLVTCFLSLTRSLAVQFGPKGIRTNAICPGPVETPLLMDWLVKDEEAKRIRLARNPTGRFGKPEEIVHVAVYLASDESRWTNGANLVIDGGITVNYF